MRKALKSRAGFLVIAAFFALGGFAETGAATIDIAPSDDSFVDNGNTGGNFGWWQFGIIGEWDGSSPYRTCRMYLKFDLSAIPAGQTINSAELNLWCREKGGAPNVWVSSRYLDSDNWTEYNITWNNAPTNMATSGNTLPVVANAYNDWTVTSDVGTAYNGDGVFSVVMRFNGEGGSAEYAKLDTKESVSLQQPFLRVEYGLCDCLPGDADGNGIYEISDAVWIIAYVFVPGSPAPTPYALCSGDADCNCIVEISDAVWMISYVLVPGSPAPCNCQGWVLSCGLPLRK